MPSRLAAAPRLAALFVVSLLLLTTAQADTKPKAPGLGDPGQIKRIEIETGRLKDGLLTIAGRDAGQQLVITAVFESGQTRDWISKVSYDGEPSGIVVVDER